MTTNDDWLIGPELLGYGNLDNSFFNPQTQTNEGTELTDYIRITKNYRTVNERAMQQSLPS